MRVYSHIYSLLALVIMLVYKSVFLSVLNQFQKVIAATAAATPVTARADAPSSLKVTGTACQESRGSSSFPVLLYEAKPVETPISLPSLRVPSVPFWVKPIRASWKKSPISVWRKEWVALTVQFSLVRSAPRLLAPGPSIGPWMPHF